jgi:hypothetical protein
VALHGAEPLPLGPLSGAEALELLSSRLGADRVDRDMPAATRLIDRCARQPLSLNLAAACGLAEPAASLDEFVCCLPVSVG